MKMQEFFCLSCDLWRNKDTMAAKLTNISDFLKGFFYGVWVGITTNPFRSNAIINEEIMQKGRKAAAKYVRTRSEIGLIPPRK
jgi:hypothetical protein